MPCPVTSVAANGFMILRSVCIMHLRPSLTRVSYYRRAIEALTSVEKPLLAPCLGRAELQKRSYGMDRNKADAWRNNLISLRSSFPNPRRMHNPSSCPSRPHQPIKQRPRQHKPTQAPKDLSHPHISQGFIKVLLGLPLRLQRKQ
jgi:hypothetical protein